MALTQALAVGREPWPKERTEWMRYSGGGEWGSWVVVRRIARRMEAARRLVENLVLIRDAPSLKISIRI